MGSLKSSVTSTPRAFYKGPFVGLAVGGWGVRKSPPSLVVLMVAPCSLQHVCERWMSLNWVPWQGLMSGTYIIIKSFTSGLSSPGG